MYQEFLFPALALMSCCVPLTGLNRLNTLQCMASGSGGPDPGQRGLISSGALHDQWVRRTGPWSKRVNQLWSIALLVGQVTQPLVKQG